MSNVCLYLCFITLACVCDCQSMNIEESPIPVTFLWTQLQQPVSLVMHFFLLMSSISKSLSHLTDCTKYFSNFTWGHSTLITQHDSHQQVIIPFASHPHYPQKWFGVSRCTILEMSASMGLYFMLQRSLWNLEDEKHFNTCSRETTENANIDGAMCEIVITGLCSSSHTCPTPLKMEIVP